MSRNSSPNDAMSRVTSATDADFAAFSTSQTPLQREKSTAEMQREKSITELESEPFSKIKKVARDTFSQNQDLVNTIDTIVTTIAKRLQRVNEHRMLCEDYLTHLLEIWVNGVATAPALRQSAIVARHNGDTDVIAYIDRTISALISEKNARAALDKESATASTDDLKCIDRHFQISMCGLIYIAFQDKTRKFDTMLSEQHNMIEKWYREFIMSRCNIANRILCITYANWIRMSAYTIVETCALQHECG